MKNENDDGTDNDWARNDRAKYRWTIDRPASGNEAVEQKRFFRNEIRHNCKAMRSGEIQLVNTESRPLESNRQDARGTRLLMMEDTKLYAVTLKELVQSN